MRRAGDLPYDWLADNTRWQRKPTTFDSVEQALQRHRPVLPQGALGRRRRLRRGLAGEGRAGRRRHAGHRAMYDVPLMVARGYASLSFLHSAAEYINELDVPTYIYHLGDFDPSGVNAGEKIEETLRELAPDADIHFERIAVTPEQIEAVEPADPADEDDATAERRASATSPSSSTRSSPTGCAISSKRRSSGTCRREQFAILKAAEESERDLIAGLVGSLQIGGGGQ